MTDIAPIIRRGVEPGVAELVMRRWSWPGPTRKPVNTFRSEGRTFGDHRVLIPTDGFYEFTDQIPTARLKHKWLFTLKDHPVFMIAGITRIVPEFGECFTMLTTTPGPDMAPYHDRQVVVLGREHWKSWLDPMIPAAQVLMPLPEHSLEVSQIR
jgi:putative SOS response-associated peptidase YedK